MSTKPTAASRPRRPKTTAECYQRLVDALDQLKSFQGATLCGTAADGSDRVPMATDVLAKVAEARAALDVAAGMMETATRHQFIEARGRGVTGVD